MPTFSASKARKDISPVTPSNAGRAFHYLYPLPLKHASPIPKACFPPFPLHLEGFGGKKKRSFFAPLQKFQSVGDQKIWAFSVSFAISDALALPTIKIPPFFVAVLLSPCLPGGEGSCSVIQWLLTSAAAVGGQSSYLSYTRHRKPSPGRALASFPLTLLLRFLKRSRPLPPLLLPQ